MDHYLTSRGWVKNRMRHILTGLIIAAVIVGAALLFWQIKTRRERSAADELADAFKMSSAIIANPVPPNTPGYAFTSEDEKNRRAHEAFEKAARDYPSINGDVARYQAAIHQLYFDAPKAEATLKELATGTSDVSSQAKMALGQYYQRNARFEEAVAQFQQLKSNPGSVPPVAADLALARTYEATGKTGEAIELYVKVATETKRSGLGVFAINRLTALAPARIDGIPMPDVSGPLGGMR